MSAPDSLRSPQAAPELEEARDSVPRKRVLPPWVKAWMPAIVWAAMIFWASTDTFSAEHTGSILEPILRWLMASISQERINEIHFLIRKSAHFTEYFIFFLLLYRGFRAGRKGWRWSWGVAAWFVAGVYACLDEIHQSFVASRTASAWDSLLDSTGALVALIVLFVFYRVFRRSTSGAPMA